MSEIVQLKKRNRLFLVALGVSILINIILVVLFVVNMSKVTELNNSYQEANTKLSEIEKKYQDLEKVHKDIKSKYDKLNQKNKKKIYLTFDDGPSANTDKIIDILKKYDVKATFFVINQQGDERYKKIIESGNAIALHTYSHDYGMYSNPNSFMNDLNKIQEKVKKITGLTIKEFRFAGGSSNSYVSDSNFNAIKKRLKAEGYRYHDWNCSSLDASGTRVSQAKIERSSTKCNMKVINLLMHDSRAKTTTVAALPKIIEHYKKLGYSFEVIDDKAIAVQHRPQ